MALCGTAPERYSERVLEEATAMINDEGLDASIRLFRLRRLLRVHHKRAGEAFDPDKPSPIERLTALLSLDLLTEADLDGFSPGVRAIAVTMGAIVRMPREIVTRDSEGLGLASCHVGLEVDYRGEAKIVEVVKFDRIPSWEKIAFEVEMWIDRNDPWSWQGEATH